MTASSGALVALLDSLTLPETLTIAVIALMVLGPEKLPGMAKTLGEWMHKLRRISANLQAEVRDVMEDPAMQPIRELGEFAAQPRRKLSEYALAAEAEAQRELETAAASQGEGPADGDEPSDGDGAVEAPTASASPTGPIVATGPDHPMERLSASIVEPTSIEEPVLTEEPVPPTAPPVVES
ncbi:MAG TPA: twin-arginine translocase TatA/TatE family subunit [Microthrixaceae bacterium]|nr:twin-arginine translocase TatA/TatE family subunit [Microthrixaceae bacterium]